MADTRGYDDQFPSPTFLFSHAVTSSNHVAQEKKYWLESVSLLLEVNFLQKKQKNNDSKLQTFLHHINEFLKNIVEEILKNLQFFSTYLLTHFPSLTCSSSTG